MTTTYWLIYWTFSCSYFLISWLTKTRLQTPVTPLIHSCPLWGVWSLACKCADLRWLLYTMSDWMTSGPQAISALKHTWIPIYPCLSLANAHVNRISSLLTGTSSPKWPSSHASTATARSTLPSSEDRNSMLAHSIDEKHDPSSFTLPPVTLTIHWYVALSCLSLTLLPFSMPWYDSQNWPRWKWWFTTASRSVHSS